jgi:hypothetical protein
MNLLEALPKDLRAEEGVDCTQYAQSILDSGQTLDIPVRTNDFGDIIPYRISGLRPRRYTSIRAESANAWVRSVEHDRDIIRTGDDSEGVYSVEIIGGRWTNCRTMWRHRGTLPISVSRIVRATVWGCEYGLDWDGSVSNVIRDCHFRNCSEVGIALGGAKAANANQIDACRLLDCKVGVHFRPGNQVLSNSIRGCTIESRGVDDPRKCGVWAGEWTFGLSIEDCYFEHTGGSSGGDVFLESEGANPVRNAHVQNCNFVGVNGPGEARWRIATRGRASVMISGCDITLGESDHAVDNQGVSAANKVFDVRCDDVVLHAPVGRSYRSAISVEGPGSHTRVVRPNRASQGVHMDGA